MADPDLRRGYTKCMDVAQKCMNHAVSTFQVRAFDTYSDRNPAREATACTRTRYPASQRDPGRRRLRYHWTNYGATVGKVSGAPNKLNRDIETYVWKCSRGRAVDG